MFFKVRLVVPLVILGGLGLVLAFILVILAPSAPSGSDVLSPVAPTTATTAYPTADTLAVGVGKRGFTAWCNSCHPNGQEGYGPALWGPGVHWSADAIQTRIRHGAREQERFAALSDVKLADIIAFIHSQEQINPQN